MCVKNIFIETFCRIFIIKKKSKQNHQEKQLKLFFLRVIFSLKTKIFIKNKYHQKIVKLYID